MFPNAKGSEQFALLATIDPASQAAGTVNSGWIPVANFHAFVAVVETGLMGTSGTLDAKIVQAQDNAGTGAKDLPGKSLLQIVKATGDNKQALINFKADDLDTNGNFAYVRLTLTIGTAASLVAGKLLGVLPRYATAEAFNQAAVVQVV